MKQTYEELYRKRGSYHWRMGAYNLIRLSVLAALLPRCSKLSLDIGCGDGYLVQKLGISVGVDISVIALGYAKERMPQKFFIVADARYLPFRTESFDLTVCAEVIEHLPHCDHSLLLREAHRVLKPKRPLILTTINKNSLSRRARNLCLGKASAVDNYHLHEYNLPQLLRKAESENFRVVTVRGAFMLTNSRMDWIMRFLWIFFERQLPSYADYLFVKMLKK